MLTPVLKCHIKSPFGLVKVNLYKESDKMATTVRDYIRGTIDPPPTVFWVVLEVHGDTAHGTTRWEAESQISAAKQVERIADNSDIFLHAVEASMLFRPVHVSALDYAYAYIEERTFQDNQVINTWKFNPETYQWTKCD